MAAFAHVESSLSESWPLGALQLVFVPPAVCPPSGLHTAAGLAILSSEHLVAPQALEQVRALYSSVCLVGNVGLQSSAAGLYGCYFLVRSASLTQQQDLYVWASKHPIPPHALEQVGSLHLSVSGP